MRRGNNNISYLCEPYIMTPGTHAMTQSNPENLRRIWRGVSTLSLVIWLASLIDIFVWAWRGGGFPLVKYFDAFQDMEIYRTRFTFFHTPTFFQRHIADPRFEWPPSAFSYPPAASLIYDAIYHFPYPVVAYVALMAAWCTLCAWATLRLLAPALPPKTSRFVLPASLLLFSFPAVFLAERGNLELFVWILITIGVVLLMKEHPHKAAVMIGLAASLKLYPLLLFGLFLRQRRLWPAMLTGFASALTVTLFAVWYCGPTFTFALHGFIEGIVKFKSEHAEAARIFEAPFDHSLFAAIKVFYLSGNASPSRWVAPYYLVACGAAASLFLLRVRRLPFLNALTYLSVVMILLPPVSYEYTIVHLYLPLLLLAFALLHLCNQDEYRIAPSQWLAFTCLLLAMVPVGMLANGRFPYAGVLQLAALLAVAGAAATSPWPLNDFANALVRKSSTARPAQSLS